MRCNMEGTSFFDIICLSNANAPQNLLICLSSGGGIGSRLIKKTIVDCLEHVSVCTIDSHFDWKWIIHSLLLLKLNDPPPTFIKTELFTVYFYWRRFHSNVFKKTSWLEYKWEQNNSRKVKIKTVKNLTILILLAANDLLREAIYRLTI